MNVVQPAAVAVLARARSSTARRCRGCPRCRRAAAETRLVRRSLGSAARWQRAPCRAPFPLPSGSAARARGGGCRDRARQRRRRCGRLPVGSRHDDLLVDAPSCASLGDELVASQSSSSGCDGGVPRVPKSSLVSTRPRPKNCSHAWLTATRAVSGFSRLTSQRASPRRFGI